MKKTFNKLFPVLLIVLLFSAIFVVPAFAQEPTPVFDWTAISVALQTLLVALLVPVAGFLARWLSAKANVEKAKLSADQMYAFELFLKTLVYAAEQMEAKQFIDSKLGYVVERAEAWLVARKINVDLDEIRARIEALVKQEFNSPLLPPQSLI